MLQKSTILVVDDEPAHQKLLVDFVLREGYNVLVASGGREALETIAREPIDLLLLDLMMAEGDGMAVLAELQKQGALPALPVVVLSAIDDRDARVDALRLGATDFVQKPVDCIEIACRIRTLIELKQLRERAVAILSDQLRESDHLLPMGFEQASVAKIDWDTTLHVKDWNPAATTLFGYTREEALGQHGSFIVAETSKAVVNGIWSQLLAGVANVVTNENVNKAGKKLICEWHNTPLKSADGILVGGILHRA